MSGPVVKSHIWPRMGKEFFAKQKISFLLLSQDCLQAQARVRLPHRSRGTHRVPLRVQQDHEVTKLMIKHRETEAILQKSEVKRRTTLKQREIDCAISEWSEELTDNLEDTEVPALANTSHDSDSERPTKVATRKHSIYSHFRKDRNCEVSACEPKWQGPLAENALAQTYLEQTILVTCWRLITKSLMMVYHGTITGTLSWYKI